MGADTQQGQSKKPVLHPLFKENRRNALYFLASYVGGPSYLQEKDGAGLPMLVKLERESLKSFKARRAIATVRNVCAPVVDRTNAYIYGRTGEDGVKRSTEAGFVEWAKNVDAEGTSFHEFMREAERAAQIRGWTWVGVDAPTEDVPSDEDKSAEKIEDKGFEVPTPEGEPEIDAPADDGPEGSPTDAYLVRVDPENVVDWQFKEGDLVRFVVREVRTVKASLFADAKTVVMLREWTPEEVRLIELDDKGNVKVQPTPPEGWEGDSVAGLRYKEVIAHNFERVPFWALEFPRGLSQISDTADSMRRIVNLKSWEDSELAKTFSTTYITGASTDSVKQVTASNTNLVCIEEVDAKVMTVGADAALAESLRKSREQEEKDVARGSNLEASYRSIDAKSPESGEKRRRDLEALYQQLRTMAQAAQTFEKELLRFIERFAGREEGKWADEVRYPSEFDAKTVMELLEEIRELQGVPFIPDEALRQRVRQMLTKDFARDARGEAIVDAVDAAPGPHDSDRAARRDWQLDRHLSSPVDLYMETNPLPEELTKEVTRPEGAPEDWRAQWEPQNDAHREYVLKILERNVAERERVTPAPVALPGEDDPLPPGVVPPEDPQDD